jgi:hypothetical protein
MRYYLDYWTSVINFSDYEIKFNFNRESVKKSQRIINKVIKDYKLGIKVFRKDREWHIVNGLSEYTVIGDSITIPR